MFHHQITQPKPKKVYRAGPYRQLRRVRLSKRAHWLRFGTGVRAKTSKLDFLKAMQGTGGIIAKIAENLNVQRVTVKALLSRPEWKDVRDHWELVCEEPDDAAENTLYKAILAGDWKAAAWWLEKRRKDKYGMETKVTHAGTVKTMNMNLNANIPFDTLNLPPDVKRAVLAAIDAGEEAAMAAELNQNNLPVLAKP